MSPNETYKRDLLRKYFEGSISDLDRHELEKIALDDPFVFDAMEGATLHQAAHKSNINELQNKLHAKDAKVIRPSFWKRISVAAGVLVLVTALFFVNRQFSSQQDMAVMRNTENAAEKSKDHISIENELEAEIPQIESTEKTAAINETADDEVLKKDQKRNTVESTQSSEGATLEKWNEVTNASTSSQAKPKQEEPFIPSPASRVVDIPSAPPAPTTAIEHKKEIKENVSANTNDEKEMEADIVLEQADKVPVLKTKSSATGQIENSKNTYAKDYAIDAKTTAESNNAPVASAFEKEQESSIDDSYDILVNPSFGTVTDENGEVLIGANVYVIGSSIGVITDFDGKFELPDSLTYPAVLEVSYTGYNSTSILLQEPTSNIAFVLDSEGLILDEVVVASKKERKKKTSASYDASSSQSSDHDVSKVHFVEGNSFPEIGGTLFDKYFAEELERRNACVQQGTYQFKFVVKRNGKLSDVNLATPVNVNCEEILIEIFEKGGDWIPKESKGKTYTQYTLKIP